MNSKHIIMFVTMTLLALLVVACGAAGETSEESELAPPVTSPESGSRPGFQGQGSEGLAQGEGPARFMNIISEATGLDPEALREEAASGATLAEIITANGGDVEAVKAELIEALSDAPGLGDQDVEQRISDLLNNPFPGGGFGGFRGGDDSEPSDASAPISAPDLEVSDAGATVFQIMPEESEVRFLLDEVLRGEPTNVVGRTDQVAGLISVDPADPANAQVGTIRVNARSLETDSQRRNQAIGRFILQTEQFEFIEFTPKGIKGLPDTFTFGEPVTFQITGDLTVRDITDEVTFETTVIPVSDTSLEGSAVATIQRADYNLVIPSVPFVADVSENVKLEIDFVATAN
jgi:polyisoprenoid-binding protein YceI